jgi:hypothetical protein
MNFELTPEMITAWGEKWGKSYLAHLKPEERLAGLKPEELEVLESYLKQRKQQH